MSETVEIRKEQKQIQSQSNKEIAMLTEKIAQYTKVFGDKDD